MFFNGVKAVAEKAISDIYTLSTGSHATQATLDAMESKLEQTKDALDEIYDKAESKRNRAWAIWLCTGIPNMFISFPWISLPLTLVSMAAAVVTGCQYLKMRSATKGLKDLDSQTDSLFRDARRQRKVQLALQHKMEMNAKLEQKRTESRAAIADVAPAADGFNTAASEIDLDQDLTVRRIKLKPKDPAVAA